MVGNDIVDLQALEFPSCQHIRHLSRVCTPAEVRSVMDSPDPSRGLAMAWASKEAAYKLFARFSSGLRFVPREFVLDAAALAGMSHRSHLRITHREIQACVEIVSTERWIHAIATFPECAVVRWSVEELKPRLPGCQQAKVESETARLLAVNLLSGSGNGDLVLEFAGKIPKVKKRSGGPADMAVSLTHHGAYAGAALAWPKTASLRGAVFNPHFSNESSWGRMCSTFTV